MIDFAHAFTRVDYRQEIKGCTVEQKRTLLKALEAICGDSTDALNELRIWLEDVLAEDEPLPTNPRRQVVKEHRTEKITYRWELVNCGKDRCKKCKKAPSHGPYWYGYWREGGKLKSKYIGKELKEPDSAPPGQAQTIGTSMSSGDAE